MTQAKGQAVLITGSREFDQVEMVRAELLRLNRPAFVIHGGAIGADRIAADCIQGDRKDRNNPNGIQGLIEVRVPYLVMEGKRGGHLRNRAMLDILLALRDSDYECWGIAFHHDIHNPSPGTAGMVKLLDGANFVVVHVDAQTGQQF